jgi:DNA-binding beta-propeller fold protein YncE
MSLRTIGPIRTATELSPRTLGIVLLLASTLALLAGACGTESQAGALPGAGADAGFANQPVAGPDAGAAGATDGPLCPPTSPPAAAGADQVMFAAGATATVTTFAGGATTDVLANPVSVALPPGGGAGLLVADYDANAILLLDGAGAATVLTKQQGFQQPFGFATAPDGTQYVDTDYDPHGAKGNSTGTVWQVDLASGAASVVAADLGRPRGLTVLPDGRLLLADIRNARLRLLDPKTGATTDLAGMPGCPGLADGVGTAAQLDDPYAAAVLPDGRIIIADHGNHALRMVSLDGRVSSFAGGGVSATVDGTLADARFVTPKSLAVDAAGNIYVSDDGAHRIRLVAADGTVWTLAGDGTAGFADGAGPAAQFYGQEGLAVTADGAMIYVADGTAGEPGTSYHRVRQIAVHR